MIVKQPALLIERTAVFIRKRSAAVTISNVNVTDPSFYMKNPVSDTGLFFSDRWPDYLMMTSAGSVASMSSTESPIMYIV